VGEADPSPVGDENSTALDLLVNALEGYGRLMIGHIYPEDTVLFPFAREIFSGDELLALGHQCERIDGRTPALSEAVKELVRQIDAELQAVLPPQKS
jgi:hemerythrin-like domain-containing protein